MGRFFGTDGVRGVVGEWPLTPEFFLKLGLAFGTVMHAGDQSISVLIGRDTRQSGQMLQNAITTGLLSSGVNVTDVGVIPTSGIAYLIRRQGYAAGVVISASHNPVEQNGVKLIDEMGLKFPEAKEIEIENLLVMDDFDSRRGKPTQPGRLINGDHLREIYIQGLIEEHPHHLLEELTFLVDCSNGAASNYATEVFSRLGGNAIGLHLSPDGKNINKDCGSEFARRAPWKMGNLIQHFEACFGLAFDGDADRVVFIDENGSLIDGDHILGFLAAYLTQKNRLLADAVVTTHMRNTGLRDYLESIGLTIFETPVGDKYVVEKLFSLRTEANDPDKLGLGGEQAGHIDIVNELFTTGDGIRTALYVMRAFLESGAPALSDFAAGIGKTPQIIASAYVGMASRYDRAALIEMEKMLFVEYPGLSRVNLRYSGTEPLLRAMLESDHRLTVNDLAQVAWKVCRSAQTLAGEEVGYIDILNCTSGGTITLGLE